MHSMTGYGKGELQEGDIQCSVEIKSVNSRYCDIYLKLPHILNSLDNKIRKLVQEKVGRGKVDIYVNFQDTESEMNLLHLNKDLAKTYISILNELTHLDSMIEPKINLDLLAQFPDIIQKDSEDYDEQVLWELLKPVFSEAINQLVEARQLEGNHLKADIKDHADNVKIIVSKIDNIYPVELENSISNYRERIQSLLGDISVDENRLLNEIAIMSDKLAIDEELSRLNSHINRLNELIELNEPVGRKLDFLIQELNRETNTIGSKTDSLEITNLVVDLKSELEKIREQVQNVE